MITDNGIVDHNDNYNFDKNWKVSRNLRIDKIRMITGNEVDNYNDNYNFYNFYTITMIQLDHKYSFVQKGNFDRIDMQIIFFRSSW